MLSQWLKYKFCTKKSLESLVGYLHDASTVIKPGRTFTRRLLDLLKSAHHRSARSFLRLNVEARSDIAWWFCFIEKWNGLSMMRSSKLSCPDVVLTSDASGNWGCGAFWEDRWFQYQWPPSTCELHITYKELFPIVVATAIWGQCWVDKVLLCQCDNEAVVSCLNTGTCRDKSVMSLLRVLYFITAKYNILLSAVHLAGKCNSIADALSRNNLRMFFDACPQANCSPDSIPEMLINLLVVTQPDWTSPTWTKMFTSICEHPLPATQSVRMPPAPKDISISALCGDLTHSQPLNPHFADLSVPLLGNISSTPQSNVICPGYGLLRSSSLIQIPSSRTCQNCITSSEASNWRKRKKVDLSGHASQ